jgi:hypothetical protein
VEIATVGLSRERCEELASLSQESMQARFPDIKVRVEGASEEALRLNAQSTKNWGTLKVFSPALHIELPWNLRKPPLEATVEALREIFQTFEPVIVTRTPEDFQR